jgi:hypothetical protein
MLKVLMTVAYLIALTGNASAMSVMTNATGPYNYTCDEFAKAKPAERALALAFAQGYFAALNMNLDVDAQVNLQERWRELNAYIVRKCTDKSNPYLYRRFVGDFVDEALDEMSKRKRGQALERNR